MFSVVSVCLSVHGKGGPCTRPCPLNMLKRVHLGPQCRGPPPHKTRQGGRLTFDWNAFLLYIIFIWITLKLAWTMKTISRPWSRLLCILFYFVFVMLNHVEGVPFDPMGLLLELQILMSMIYNLDPSLFVHRFTTGLVSSDSNTTHIRSDISLDATSLNATRIKSNKTDELLRKTKGILHTDKFNVTNYKSGIGKFDRYLLRKYRVPQRHKFNVTSGDILIFHHIQKTGK